MTKNECIELIKGAFDISDLDGLNKLLDSGILEDQKDEEEARCLLRINDIIGVGWGADLLHLGDNVWYEIESQYYDRKAELLK